MKRTLATGPDGKLDLPDGLTNHASLLDDECAEVAEDVVKLVDAALYLSDLGLALIDLSLLEVKLMRRDRPRPTTEGRQGKIRMSAGLGRTQAGCGTHD